MSPTADDLKRLAEQSVQTRAHETLGSMIGIGAPGLNLMSFFRQKSDLDIPPYGYGGRAIALRRVWRLVGADIIASAIAVMIQKVQSTAYTIEGPERTVRKAQQMIDLSAIGRGWLEFVAEWVIDYCTQDNGAIAELLGPGPSLTYAGVVQRNPDGMPIVDTSKPLTGQAISFANLDSASCERTGVYVTPIRYYDINGTMHWMHTSRVYYTADMPQPDEHLFGYGFCALSRCISMVQYMINWATARNEALDNMPPLSIMALENINQAEFEKQLEAQELSREGLGDRVLRSLMTLVQQDPTKPTGVKLTPIRQLWESFDEQVAFQITVNTVAMAFGLDPQDLAPLSSSAMGSGAQSTILQAKQAGKGYGLVLTQLEQLMKSVLPKSVTLRFDRHDDEQDRLQAEIRNAKIDGITKLYSPVSASPSPIGNPASVNLNSPVLKAFDAQGNPLAADGTSAARPSASPPAKPTPPDPNSLPLLTRDQALLVLMHEIPEWSDIIDPDMTIRDEVIVDDLDPELAGLQQKMYGGKARLNSSTRQIRLLEASRSEYRQKAVTRPGLVAPLSTDEIAEARQRLADIGIDVNTVRELHA